MTLTTVSKEGFPFSDRDLYKLSLPHSASSAVFDMHGISAQFFDAKGMLIKSIPLNSEKTQIDISNLAKGFYIVKVENEVKKLIVK